MEIGKLVEKYFLEKKPGNLKFDRSISVGKYTIQEYVFEQNGQNASQKAQTLDKIVRVVLNTLGKYDENVRK